MKLDYLKLILLSIITLGFLIPGTAKTNLAQGIDIDGGFVTNRILVKFKESVSNKQKMRIHSQTGSNGFKNSYKNIFQIVTVKNGDVERMVKLYSQNPNVEIAEPDYIRRASFTPNDELFPLQWNLSQINCQQAWEISTGQGVIVAVIDTGVNESGFDSFGGRVLPGHDFVHGDDDATDTNSHGTHVAGTVAQATNNGTGVAGVAFNASILPVRVLNRFGAGSASGTIDGIRWAADNGAQVINLSLGGGSFSQLEQSVITEAHDKGVVIIAAAGNSGRRPVEFPAAYEHVIAVGAVDFSERRASYSTFGKNLDIMAPGGNTNVDINRDGLEDGVLQETFINLFSNFGGKLVWDYRNWQGTSQATPHVAGLAALLIAVNPLLTPDEIFEVMKLSAKDLEGSGWDQSTGWGLIDAEAALLSITQ